MAITYELPDGGGRLPFRLLQGAGAVAGAPLAALSRSGWHLSEKLAVVVERNDAAAIEGAVELPPATGEPLRITLRYPVAIREPDGRYRLPLPVAAWPPGEPGRDTFVATLRVPAGLALHGVFPSRIEEVAEQGSGAPSVAGHTPGVAVYRCSLPVVPSRLVFDLHPRGAARLTAERTIDLAAAALLGGLALAGWRRIRRELA